MISTVQDLCTSLRGLQALTEGAVNEVLATDWTSSRRSKSLKIELLKREIAPDIKYVLLPVERMIWGNVFSRVLNHCVSDFTCLLFKRSYTFLSSAFQRQCDLSCRGQCCQDDLGDVCNHFLPRSYQFYCRVSRTDYSCLQSMTKLFLELLPNLYTEMATESLPGLLYILSSGLLTF